MRRLAVVFALAVVAVAAILAIGFALLPREALKTRIAEQISGWTGRDVSLRGEPEISFFPRLRVTLRDVTIGGPAEMPDADLLSTDELTGTIRLLPLLIGSVEIETFHMLRPRITLVRGAGKTRNWTLDSGAAALQLAFSGDVPLGEFVLQDGTFIYEDRNAGLREAADAIDISVEWESIRQPFTMTGRATWRGELMELNVRAEDPFAFLKRDPTAVEASLQSAPVQIAFSGQASRTETIRLAGRLDLSSPSLQRMAAWSGLPAGPAFAGAASLSGDALIEGGHLGVERAELDLSGQRATGAINVAIWPDPTLGGTLDFEALDLTPYLAAALPAPPTGAGGWRDIRPATDWLPKLSADVRLSASSVRLGPVLLGATAATVSLSQRVLEIGIGEAVLAGGTLAGDVTLADRGPAEGSTTQMQLRASGITLRELAPQLGLSSGLAGTAAATTDLQSSGVTLGDHLRSLSGSGSLEILDGTIRDGGLANLVARLAPAPVEAAGGSAPFSELKASMRFGQERATVETARIATPAWEADVTGDISLLDGSLALGGQLRPVGAPGAPAVPQPISIGGTLAAPAVGDAALAN